MLKQGRSGVTWGRKVFKGSQREQPWTESLRYVYFLLDETAWPMMFDHSCSLWQSQKEQAIFWILLWHLLRCIENLYLSVCMSVYLSVCLHVCMYIYLPMFLSTYLSYIYLSVYVSIVCKPVSLSPSNYLCIILPICQYSSIHIYHLSSIYPLFLHCIPVNQESYTIYLVFNPHLSSINLSIYYLLSYIIHSSIIYLQMHYLISITSYYLLSFFLVINQLSIHLYLWV